MGLWVTLTRLREQARRASDIGLTLLAAATVFLVVAVVADGPDRSPSSLVADDRPSADSVLETDVPEVVYSEVPSAEASASATAVPALTPAAGPVAATSLDDAPGPGLRLNVSAAPAGGLRVRIAIRVRDDNGSWNGGSVSFGDGTRQAFPRSSRCAAGSAATDSFRTITHTYSRPGTYSVLVTVRTDRVCAPTPVETVSRGLRVTVSRTAASAPRPPASASPTRGTAPRPTPAPSRTQPRPDPTPEPSASPTPEPEPSPTAAPEPSAEPSPHPSETHPR